MSMTTKLAGKLAKLVAEPRIVALIVACLSAAALAGAYGSQYLGGLAPCPLCLWQRPPYMIAGPLAVLAAITPLARMRFVALGLAVLAVGCGAGIAVFHVGVEQHWWGGLEACSAPQSAAEEVAEIVKLLQGGALGRCDEIAWTLFGLSMAAYNAVLATGLTLLGAIGVWRAGLRTR